MEKEELDKLLEKDVLYLQRNIAPDDIYLFAQNSLLCSYLLAFELMKIVGKENFEDLPKITQRCLQNVSRFKYNQQCEIDMDIDLNANGLA